MKVSENGVRVLKHYEDCELEAYPDPGTGGDPWTIGWGYTGPEVVPGLRWSQEMADHKLVKRLSEFEVDVEGMLQRMPKQGQFDALVLFAYNVGAGALHGSTLLKRFNAGDDDEALAFEFNRWIKSGGKVMRGLKRRRAAEVALYKGLSGDQAIAVGTAAA